MQGIFFPSYADQDSYVIDLAPIIISAKRVESVQGSSAEDVAVYSKEAIQQTSARDLGEVLSHIPAVDVQLSGQFGQVTSLSIHGSKPRQVLLMVDGIPFNTQLSGQANPSVLPIENIERIEVIKGASSSAWGSSLGGVVNVITKDVGNTLKPKGGFTSSFAEFSTTKNSLNLAGKVFDIGYFVSGSYMETDGAQAVTNVKQTKLFGKIAHDFNDEVKVTGSFGYSGVDELKYALTAGSAITSQPNVTKYGKVSLNINKEERSFEAAFKYNDQEIITDIGASSTVSSNVFQGISLKSSFELAENHSLVFGSDFDWHILKSSNYLDASKNISMQAPYANYTLAWKNWDFIPGVRYDHNQQFGSQTSPSFGIVYRFEDSRDTSFRAKVSRGFNAPPLLWIYNSDPSIWVGANPNLKAERSFSYEVGLASEVMSSLEMEINAYRTDVKDAIALTLDAVNSVYIQQNFRKFRRQGAELLLNYKANDEISFYGSGAFNDVENRATGQIVRDQGVARQKFTFGAKYKNQRGLNAHLSGYYARWSSEPSLNANDRKPIFDVKVSKRFKDVRKDVDVETFLNVHNLTNSKYWSSSSFPLPKRYFEGGFSVNF